MEQLVNILKETGINSTDLELLHSTDLGSIYYWRVAKEVSYSDWQKLHRIVDLTGRWPLVLKGDKAEWVLDDIMFSSYPVKDRIEEAVNLDVSSWFNNRWNEAVKEVQNEEGINLEEEIIGWFGKAETKKARKFRTSKNVFKQRQLAARQIAVQPEEDYLLALLPTNIGWQVPAFFDFGTINDCPDAIEHIAVLKHWYELYNAELVLMSHRELQLSVSCPVQDEKQAIILAKEWYAYCWDSWRTASSLIGLADWFFWWD